MRRCCRRQRRLRFCGRRLHLAGRCAHRCPRGSPRTSGKLRGRHCRRQTEKCRVYAQGPHGRHTRTGSRRHRGTLDRVRHSGPRRFLLYGGYRYGFFDGTGLLRGFRRGRGSSRLSGWRCGWGGDLHARRRSRLSRACRAFGFGWPGNRLGFHYRSFDRLDLSALLLFCGGSRLRCRRRSLLGFYRRQPQQYRINPQRRTGLRRRLAGITDENGAGKAAAHEKRELFASGSPIHPNTSVKSNLLTGPPAQHPTERVVKSPHFST